MQSESPLSIKGLIRELAVLASLISMAVCLFILSRAAFVYLWSNYRVFIISIAACCFIFIFYKLFTWKNRREIQSNSDHTIADDQYRYNAVSKCNYRTAIYDAKRQLTATYERHRYDADSGHIYEYAPLIETRLAAIAELRRISDQSPHHHIEIMSELCQFVRVEAPARIPRKMPLDVFTRDTMNRERRDVLLTSIPEWLMGSMQPREDIQAALTAIAKRKMNRIILETGLDGKQMQYRLDLRHTNLRLYTLRQGRFENAIFHGAWLDGADLSHARLSGAQFDRASMIGTYLEFAKASGAIFAQTRLTGAKLSNARLEDVDFTDADLQASEMTRCRAHRAQFTRTRLEWASMWDAQLQSANLRDANLLMCSLSGADLRDIRSLSSKQISGSFGCARTVMPDDLARSMPPHWYPRPLAKGDARAGVRSEWAEARENGGRPPWVAEGDWTGWSDS